MEDEIAGTSPSLDWDDLRVILAICRAGTVSGAARALGVNHTTVSRRINAIEERSAVRFFERMPNGYVMTEAGEAALEHGERIESEMNDFGLKVLGRDRSIAGRIRLTCPEGLALTVLPALLAEFHAEYPNVTIDLVPGLVATDPTRHEAEVAIRITPKPPESAFGRNVAEVRFALYSSRAYLDRVGDLRVADHDFCIIADTETWLVPHVWPSVDVARERAVLFSRSSLAVTGAVAAGMGTMGNACFVADGDPRLVRISAPIEQLDMGLWVLTHPDLRRIARVRALMSFLAEALPRHRRTFRGETCAGGVDIRWPDA